MGSSGYTHFNKISGINGVYTGARGSESPIPTTGAVAVQVLLATTAAGDAYVVTPLAGVVTGYACFAVSAGTGRLVTVTDGATEVCKTAVTGANGTVGAPVTMTVKRTTATPIGTTLKVAVASCATAQVACTATLVITPAVEA